MDQLMNRQIDQTARSHRNKVITDLTRSALSGLIASHPADMEMKHDELAKDAVAIAKATARELMLQRIL